MKNAILAWACPLLVASCVSEPMAERKERTTSVTVEVDLMAPAEAKRVRLWIPCPMSDKNQDITDVSVTGNYSASAVHRSRKFGNGVLYAEWREPSARRTLAFSFQVRRMEMSARVLPPGGSQEVPEEDRPYLEPTSLGPTSGKVKDRAKEATKGKRTVLEKARAIYDYVLDTMRRDPDVKGCGQGDVEKLLETRAGKCADINSVFVSLARAAGIPARETFGLRIPAGEKGEMTKAQHCWAEFRQPGCGWIAVDPADVLKAILERKLGPGVEKPFRDYYFGAVDENRIAFGVGRDVVLDPPQDGGPLNYFMYPYAEADGKPLNEDLYGWNLGYRITFREALR